MKQNLYPESLFSHQTFVHETFFQLFFPLQVARLKLKEIDGRAPPGKQNYICVLGICAVVH